MNSNGRSEPGNSAGRKCWFFPDGERPPVTNGVVSAHESLIVFNPNSEAASVQLSLYFSDRDPVDGIVLNVPAQRVISFRMNEPDELGGVVIPEETQYAIWLRSDVPVIAQYGRADTRQENLAFYTTMGFPGEI